MPRAFGRWKQKRHTFLRNGHTFNRAWESLPCAGDTSTRQRHTFIFKRNTFIRAWESSTRLLQSSARLFRPWTFNALSGSPAARDVL